MFKVFPILSIVKELVGSYFDIDSKSDNPPHFSQNTLILPSPSTLKESVTHPFYEEYISINKAEYIQLKWDANYWKSQHERALEREAALKVELAEKEANIRDLKQRLYGKKSEKGKSKKDDTGDKSNCSRRNRGQQEGTAGHGRTLRPDLPVIEEIHDLKDEEKICPICNTPYVPFYKTEDSDILEVEVKAHIRRIRRKSYVKGCQCDNAPGIITAPPADRLIPQGAIGLSVWVEVLIGKYLYSRPLNRICQEFNDIGMPISPGTLVGGMKKLAPLFEPLLDEMLKQQMTERLFHGDETRWMVFEFMEGKIGYRWYLWIIQSASVLYYRIAPGRNAEVPIWHFAGLDKNIEQAILVCDRYSAYKRLAKFSKVFLLAFCWAHVRRDFLDAARAWPELEAWMFTWVEDIRELYHINNQRLEQWDESKSLDEQSAAFDKQHQALVKKLTEIDKHREECQQEELHSAQAGVLNSLKNHWSGLTLFVDHPAVPLDNNTAEQGIRNQVTGRKVYYGSGRIWSAELAAMLFTLLQTVMHWKLNPKHWLYYFLSDCAKNGGKTPDDLTPYLPWKMSLEQRQLLSKPLPLKNDKSFEVFDPVYKPPGLPKILEMS